MLPQQPARGVHQQDIHHDGERPHVVLYLDVHERSEQTSYVYTGLFGLASENRITLETRAPARGDWRRSGRGFVALDAWLSGGISVPVCIELRDHSERFYQEALLHSTIYFKRNYREPDLQTVPPEMRPKILPFGLCYPCADARVSWEMLRFGVREMWTAREHDVMEGWRALASQARRSAAYWRLPRPSEFEISHALPKEPTIVFQPRLWEASLVGDENSDVVNEDRVAVVRALRKEFGKRFKGGLVPTPMAQSRYPDLISKIPPTKYLSLIRRGLVGIYTRGLHHSIAWKLGEYFAASMCVVAEPIRNVVEPPIVAGDHYLPFTSPDECIEASARILESRELQQQLRETVFNYHQRHVEPAARIWECLERVRADL